MFTFGRQSKEEPERPRPIDLGKGKPDTLTPGRRLTPPMFAGMPLLARRLDAINGKVPPSLPPVAIANEYDQRLAGLVEAATRTAGEAIAAATAWLSAVQGDGLTAAIDAERRQVQRRDLGRSPLLEHLTTGTAKLFVEAIRAQTRAEMADGEARAHGATLTATLDKETDRLADDIKALLTRARDGKDRRSYLAAVDTAEEWARASSLYEWSLDTAKSFRQRQAKTIPAEFAYLDWEASAATGNETAVVPLESLQRAGAPPPAGAPTGWTPGRR